MAWTNPKTFIPENTVTAAELNLYVRNNLLVTEASLASAVGQLLVAAGPNAVAMRQVQSTLVTGSVSTSATVPTTLSGAGPSITFTHGGAALVFFGALMRGNTGGVFSCAPYLSTDPSDIRLGYAIQHDGTGSVRYGGHLLFSGMTPGSANVGMRYWTDTGITANYSDRQLTVIPL